MEFLLSLLLVLYFLLILLLLVLLDFYFLDVYSQMLLARLMLCCSPALYANIPIVSIKEDVKRVAKPNLEQKEEEKIEEQIEAESDKKEELFSPISYFFILNNLLIFSKNPFSFPGIVTSIFSPNTLLAISKYALPEGAYCPAGIEQGFKNAIAGANRAIVVTTAEISAIRDADRIIGLLESSEIKNPELIVNRLKPNMVRRGETHNNI